MTQTTRPSPSLVRLGDLVTHLISIARLAEQIQRDPHRAPDDALELLFEGNRALAIARAVESHGTVPECTPSCRIDETLLAATPVLRYVAGRAIPLLVTANAATATIGLASHELQALLVVLVAAARDVRREASGSILIQTRHVQAPLDSDRIELVVQDDGGPLRREDVRWALIDDHDDPQDPLFPLAMGIRAAGGSIRTESRGERQNSIRCAFPLIL
jgi:hypothetical protein